ncbi:MAG: SDR family NAD(P)-dependent oxidoreductase [Thermoanaerobaculia bacterium]
MTASEPQAPRGYLVAGGSSGIGRALVGELAGRGSKVVSLDRSLPPQEPAGAVTYLVDLLDEDAVQAAVAEIAGHHPELDRLALVAGVAFATPFLELSGEEFRRQVAANLDLAFYLSQAAVKAWPLRSMVLLSSSSVYGGIGASASYIAAKAGILGLTRALALELAPRGIRVNAVVPGPVDTPLFRGLSTATERRILSELTPLKRLAEPEAVAEVIRFLLDEGSRHMTGQTVPVDGGLSLAFRPSL